MRWSRHDPVTIRGVTYPNAMAAADKFGCTVAHISNASRKGRLEFVGIPAHKSRPAGSTVAPYPVMVRGRVFASAKDCAKALRVTANTVRKAVSAGRADYIGKGKSRKHTAKRCGAPRDGKPFVAGGFTWESHSSAARFMGISRQTLRRRSDAGDVEFILAAAMRAQAASDKAIIKEKMA